MLYSALITNLRNQSGDVRRRVHVDFTGDASTTIFQLPTDTFPVYDGSGTYTLKVATVAQVENTDYTVDKQAGTIVFTNAAPALAAAITWDASAVYLTDTDWLEVINAVIRSLGDDFWKEFVDTSATLITTANMTSLSLATAQANCIAVYEFQHRVNTSEDWKTVESYDNWRYDRENNVIYIGSRDTFTVANELFRVRGLKTYTIGATTAATLDVQDKFLTILEYGSLARFWRYRYKNVVELVSKMSQENSRTPLQELIMLSDRFDRLYEAEKAKLKPQKPPRVIPRFKEGSPRP